MGQNLQRLISPKSIVVFGSRGADFAIRGSQEMGFTGDIWVVHPTRDSLEGLSCYESLKDLPDTPDAAFIAVNAEAAIEIVAELSAIGAGGAVMYTSGFGEVGEKGVDRNVRLLEAAGTMPIIGPNCYGFLNTLDQTVLWPDIHGCDPVERGVAIITQSGNIGLNMTMQSIGLDIAYMFTLGNQANVDIADVMEAMLEDARVNAIGLHIEGIKDITRFDEIARKALSKKVPIVAIKSGRTEASAEIALSHTSSLTGSDALFDVYFERLGIARVDTVPEFLETLKLLSIIGPLEHNGIASMSCLGGEAGMMADLIDGLDVHFKTLDVEHKKSVQNTLNEYVEVNNPLDYHTFIWGNREQTSECFTAMLHGDFAATMLLLDWPKIDPEAQHEWDNSLLSLADAMRVTGNKGIVLASMADCMPKRVIALCKEHGIAPMIGLDTCLKALHCAYRCNVVFNGKTKKPIQVLHNKHKNTSEAYTLNEYDAKQSLANYGLKVPKALVVSNIDEARFAVETLGFPVTLKALSEKISHKSELNAVRLNICSDDELQCAANDLLQIAPDLLIETMVEDVVAELIIGVNTDPLFGRYIVLGCGGVLVEILQDSVPLLLPINESDVKFALSQLKIYPVLTGYRGKSGTDIEAIVASVMAVARYIEKVEVEELDINPLLALKDGKGAIAVDALVKLY